MLYTFPTTTYFSNWNWMLASCLFFSCSFVSALAWWSWKLSSLMIVRVGLQVMANHSVKGYSELYASPEDIDLWTAGISERPLPGSMVSLFNNRSYCLILFWKSQFDEKLGRPHICVHHRQAVPQLQVLLHVNSYKQFHRHLKWTQCQLRCQLTESIYWTS